MTSLSKLKPRPLVEAYFESTIRIGWNFASQLFQLLNCAPNSCWSCLTILVRIAAAFASVKVFSEAWARVRVWGPGLKSSARAARSVPKGDPTQCGEHHPVFPVFYGHTCRLVHHQHWRGHVLIGRGNSAGVCGWEGAGDRHQQRGGPNGSPVINSHFPND